MAMDGVPQGVGPSISVTAAAAHLVDVFKQRHPKAASFATQEPIAALDHVEGLKVEWVATLLSNMCDVGGLYDGRKDPALITIYESWNAKRDSFTALHELGHHLAWNDHVWQRQIRPDVARKARAFEEATVDVFASRVLLPAGLVESALGSGVTPDAILDLGENSQASLTACCVRALDEPGDRIVFLSSADGTVLYSGASGELYSPGRSVDQPMLAEAVERAKVRGSYKTSGGGGIRYSSGRAREDVVLDVTIRGGLAVAVVTPARPQRAPAEWGAWELDCSCGETFRAVDAAGTCRVCEQPKCPECGRCECSAAVASVCVSCSLELSASEVSRGLTKHEDC